MRPPTSRPSPTDGVGKWFDGAPTDRRTAALPLDFRSPNSVPSRLIVHTIVPDQDGRPARTGRRSPQHPHLVGVRVDLHGLHTSQARGVDDRGGEGLSTVDVAPTERALGHLTPDATQIRLIEQIRRLGLPGHEDQPVPHDGGGGRTEIGSVALSVRHVEGVNDCTTAKVDDNSITESLPSGDDPVVFDPFPVASQMWPPESTTGAAPPNHTAPSSLPGVGSASQVRITPPDSGTDTIQPWYVEQSPAFPPKAISTEP